MKRLIMFMVLVCVIFGETKTVEVVYEKFDAVHLDHPINVDFRIFNEGWIHMEEYPLGKGQMFSIIFDILETDVHDYRHLVVSVGDIEMKIDLVDWTKDEEGNSVLEYTVYNIDNFFRSTFGSVLGKDISMKIYGFNKEVLYEVKFTPEAQQSFWKSEAAYYKVYVPTMNSRGGSKR